MGREGIKDGRYFEEHTVIALVKLRGSVHIRRWSCPPSTYLVDMELGLRDILARLESSKLAAELATSAFVDFTSVVVGAGAGV